MGFLDLLDPSDGPEFFWHVISGPTLYISMSCSNNFWKTNTFAFFPNQILIAYKQNSI
jgi:hypothetical protein